jgi:hypothetical protein
MGDITALVPDEQADFCILEEPEHLNWYVNCVLRGCLKLLLYSSLCISSRLYLWCRYKAPFTAKAWMEKFKHVVGVIHTNYLSYIRSNTLGQLKEPFVYYMNQGTLLCVPYSAHRDWWICSDMQGVLPQDYQAVERATGVCRRQGNYLQRPR